MGFQLRYHPCLVRARELIQAGQLGRLISAHVHFGEYLPAGIHGRTTAKVTPPERIWVGACC